MSQARLQQQVAVLGEDLSKLSADNAVLRGELAKMVHLKQSTNSRLEEVRRKLGMSEAEANTFVQVSQPPPPACDDGGGELVMRPAPIKAGRDGLATNEGGWRAK